LSGGTMTECVFCNIINGTLKGEFVYNSDEIVAFKDINPQAPVHILIVPRKHIATMNDLTEADRALVGNMFIVANRLAKELGIADHGYRVVVNCNRNAGQAIYHLHLHLLGGRRLGWPPG